MGRNRALGHLTHFGGAPFVYKVRGMLQDWWRLGLALGQGNQHPGIGGMHNAGTGFGQWWLLACRLVPADFAALCAPWPVALTI